MIIRPRDLDQVVVNVVHRSCDGRVVVVGVAEPVQVEDGHPSKRDLGQVVFDAVCRLCHCLPESTDTALKNNRGTHWERLSSMCLHAGRETVGVVGEPV